MKYFALLFLFSAPFWESKAPADWTEAELNGLLTDSPWAQMMPAPGNAAAPPVQIFFETAAPIEQAQREWDRRFNKKPAAPNLPKEEFQEWMRENRATQVVIAIATADNKAFSDERETRQMEQESVMRVGRKKLKMTGHFPPSPGDPYLRMAFPREVTASDKTVEFDLYLPGVGMPFRGAEFKVKDMVVNGKLEM